jgi:hypothetical protein
MTHHKIELRFLRKKAGSRDGAASSDKDDILEIFKLGENSVRLIYTENDGSSTPLRDVIHCNYQQALTYVYRAFMLLALDDDPFLSVQIRAPGYPCALLHVKKIKENLPIIMELLATTCWNWPAVAR